MIFRAIFVRKSCITCCNTLYKHYSNKTTLNFCIPYIRNSNESPSKKEEVESESSSEETSSSEQDDSEG